MQEITSDSEIWKHGVARRGKEQDIECVERCRVGLEVRIGVEASTHTRRSGCYSARAHRGMQKAWLESRSGVQWEMGFGRVLGPPRKKRIFRLKWRVSVNFERYFLKIGGTVCITVADCMSTILPYMVWP